MVLETEISRKFKREELFGREGKHIRKFNYLYLKEKQISSDYLNPYEHLLIFFAIAFQMLQMLNLIM